MTPATDRAKSIFLQALECAEPGARRACLDAKCGGDAALRREVEELLEHHQHLGGFLEPPAVVLDPTGSVPPRDAEIRSALERPGTSIGPYRLLERLGEGGMGV